MVDILKVLEKHQGEAPVPIFDVVREMGLDLKLANLEDDVSGWIERRDDGGYCVTINSNHAITRQRFTAAHELGHFIYHRDLLGKGTGDTRAYRAERTPFANELIRPRHERQANNFAANLLMPREAISRLSEAGCVSLDQLAEHFSVSREAMRIRLGD